MVLPEHSIPGNPYPPTCGECGYSLTGLPANGTCPECGVAHDADLLILPGWGSGSRETIANAPPDRVARVGLGAVVALIAITVFISSSHRIIRYFFIVGLVAAIALQFFRRWRLTTDYSATCHARLSASGFGQRDGFGPVILVPWRHVTDYEISLVSGGRRHLRIAAEIPEEDVVSIELVCSLEQAAWLVEAIVRYRREDDIGHLMA